MGLERTLAWNWLDWTLVGVVLLSAFTAFLKGFIRELISLAALVAGLVVAAVGYQRASAWFEDVLLLKSVLFERMPIICDCICAARACACRAYSCMTSWGDLGRVSIAFNPHPASTMTRSTALPRTTNVL